MKMEISERFELIEQIKKAYAEAPDKVEWLNDIRGYLHDISPFHDQPVDYVKWVKNDKVRANDYNPNSVAQNELRLLHVSIEHDGYTQPIVSVTENDHNVIVDGFHRYFVERTYPDIRERCHGYLPVVEIQKDINDRMASTIRHNRARGKHAVTGMSNIVFQMLDNGWEDTAICSELGMEADELVRLKHITGFSKLFENIEYRRAWVNKRQIELKKKVANES
jgi:ParB-like chromosome segregation protein Spo0J